jgi:hypothetical protein
MDFDSPKASTNTWDGIWLKPLQGQSDDSLDWPAKVRLSLRIQSFSDCPETDGLTIPMKEYTWTKEDTKSINPVLKFDLLALKHSAIDRNKCVIVRDSEEGSSIRIIIEEDAIA